MSEQATETTQAPQPTAQEPDGTEVVQEQNVQTLDEAEADVIAGKAQPADFSTAAALAFSELDAAMQDGWEFRFFRNQLGSMSCAATHAGQGVQSHATKLLQSSLPADSPIPAYELVPYGEPIVTDHPTSMTELILDSVAKTRGIWRASAA